MKNWYVCDIRNIFFRRVVILALAPFCIILVTLLFVEDLIMDFYDNYVKEMLDAMKRAWRFGESN